MIKFWKKIGTKASEYLFPKSRKRKDIVSKDSDFENNNSIINNSDYQNKQQLDHLQSIKDSEESKLIMHSESSTNDSQNDHSNQNQSNLDQNNSNMLSNDDPKVDQLENSNSNSISDSNSSSIDIQGQFENQQESQTISQEKSEIIQEEQANSQEKPTVLKEDPTVLQEIPTVSQEKPTVLQEEPTVLKEDTTTLKEKPSISKEKPVNQQKRSKTKYTHKLKYYHRYIPLRGNRRCIEITMFPEINVIPPQNPSSIPPPNVNQEDGNNSGN